MTALQKVNLGTAPAGSDGDAVRTAFIKDNANVDVLNSQTALTSVALITTAQALTTAHIGKRVNINLTTAGTINLPAASTCAVDQVTLLRNTGTTVVTLAITSGSGDTVSVSKLNPGESTLMDTDGVHTWSCLIRGRTNSDNETVNGNCTVNGNETVLGSISTAGNITLSSTSARLLCDFSNATLLSRTLFESATLNGVTSVGAIANGSGTSTDFTAYGAADPTNAPYARIRNDSIASYIESGKNGSGSYTQMLFYVGGAERARFDTLGRMMIGISSVLGGAQLTVNVPSGSNGHYVNIPSGQTGGIMNGAGGYTPWVFQISGVTVGSIFSSGSSTAFNTSSDYRIKENVQPLTGAADRLLRMRVYRLNYKTEPGNTVDSFLAHEVSEVIPEAVRGEKDAVDADGNMVVQQMDYSKVVPLLTAALQEALVRIAALEAKVAA